MHIYKTQKKIQQKIVFNKKYPVFFVDFSKKLKRTQNNNVAWYNYNANMQQKK